MNTQAPNLSRPKPRLTIARVEHVRQISPSFRRLRLVGDFRGFVGGGVHFRFVLGPQGAPWPTATEDGFDWPGGADAWHRPPYTIRAMDPGGGWLDTDIFLHDGGRVTAWTETLQPGDAVALTGPGGGGLVQAGWMGLVGDETALPVILRTIEALPQTARGQAFIRVPHPDDAQPVALPPGFRLKWVTPDSGLSLPDLLHRLTPPAGDRHIFFAAERAEAEAARLWMTAQGIGKGESRAASYWQRATDAPLFPTPNTRTDPMFIAMNRFTVPLENAAAFEALWLGRNSQLHELEGFVEFHMLKGPEEDGQRLYASHTVWESEAHFQGWTRSAQFRAAHVKAGDARKLHTGAPKFEGFTTIQHIGAAARA